MDENQTVRSGLLETLRRLSATAPALIQNRLELPAVELQEAQLFNALLLTAAIAGPRFLSLALAVLALVVALRQAVDGSRAPVLDPLPGGISRPDPTSVIDSGWAIARAFS